MRALCSAQVDFLFDVYEEVTGDEPLSFLEVGCGPAQHSLEMAESKLQVFCVDREPKMLEYATALAAEDDLQITAIQADMREFQLPVCSSVPGCLLAGDSM
jgi:2-polyprenyl-3-methyl-5-hydroxy-6-metoxy-1,4-benzoquinol methylase